MKAKALLFTALLAAAAMASAQDTIQFGRSYKQGDKDKYSIKVKTAMAMGEIDMSMVMSQEIVKVYDNGDADLKTDLSDMKLLVGGQDFTSMAPPEAFGKGSTVRVDKAGKSVGKEKTAQDGMLGGIGELLNIGSMLGEKPLKVGETVKIDKTGEDGKRKITGTLRVESVTDGVAKVVTNIQIMAANAAKPMTVDLVSLIEVASSKPHRIDADVKGIPGDGSGMSPENAKLVMERIKA